MILTRGFLPSRIYLAASTRPSPIHNICPMQTSSGSTSTPTAVVSSDKESDPASAPISLPIYSWKSYNPNAKLLYLRNVDEANREIAKLRPGPIGFDLEWKPTFVRGFPENPVALVQIANDDAILVIQVSAMAGEQSFLCYIFAIDLSICDINK